MLDFIGAVARLLLAIIKSLISNQLLKRFPPAVRPIVRVRQGQLRGVTSTLPNGSTYHYFKGIPYAKPPVGELRFRPPVPIDRFYYPIVDCLVDRSICIQPAAGSFTLGKENGLFLNVYTPARNLPQEEDGQAAANLLPVMVWIHGGGFLSGSGDSFIYDPVHIVQEGVVVVGMNYRLGLFGFLSLPGAGIAGNAGLKDQLLVFKWVQENIAKFGGDPDNVTVFGESAGSMSAYLHYLSPNSRKYFHRVVCQSGVACTSSFFQTDASNKARELAKIFGYNGNDDAKALDVLLKVPAKLLMKHRHDIMTEHEKGLALQMLYRPVIEEELTEDSIITEPPEEILKRYDTIRMPLINGCTNSEGILGLLMIKKRLSEFDQQVERLVPQLLGNPPGLNRTKLGTEIREFYFGNKRIDRNSLIEMCDLMSDNIFFTNTMISAEWIAKYQPNVKHFHYRFTYEGRYSFTKHISKMSQVPGACHGDDIFYLFSPKLLSKLSDDSDECLVRNILIRLWTNFAKFGDPTPDDQCDDQLLGAIRWTPVNPIGKQNQSNAFNLNCLEINTHPKMVCNPCDERIQLWRRILNTYRKDFL